MGETTGHKTMDKRLLLMVALLLLVAGTAAAQTKKGNVEYTYGYDEATARSIDPVATAHTTPIVADLTVSQKRITHKEVFSNNISSADLLHPEYSAEINYLKSYTLTQAVKENNADVMLVPVFDIRTSEDMKTITVEVTGYPASYSNFRKATTADLDLIRQGYTTSNATPKPTETHTTIINTEEK